MAIKALVVDNNPVHLRAVSEILSQEKCNVITASNGLEALEKIQENIPDILFTDLIMPMVDGEKLCRIVRGVDEYKDIFVVLLSAIIVEDRDRILSDLDYDLCIAKGTIQEMRSHLREALQQYETKGEISKNILGVEQEYNENRPASVTKELLLEKDHLLLMLENLSEGVIELSSNGRVVSINDAAVKMWDCRREDVIGKKFRELSFGNQSAEIKVWSTKEIENQGGKKLEILEDNPLIIKDRVYTATLLPIRHRKGFFALCIFRDISRQYYAEKKKKEMDNAVKLIKKMEAMSFMAGGVAHDFNNLLTVICGNLDMISIDDSAESQTSNIEFLKNAKLSAYSAVELVRKISNFSPFGIIRRKNVIFADLAEKLVKDFFSQPYYDTGYDLKIGCRDCYVNIDASQIETALRNILQNSIEAKSRKPIEISLIQENIDKQTIKSGQYISPGNYLKLMVKDWGVGIGRKNQHEIFDPYYSTKERSSLKGIGLGLTIVYSTLRNHAGYVVVESEKDRWTAVSLYLPLVRKISGTKKADRTGILVVESDEDLQIISKIMLQHLDYKPVIVPNKAMATEILREDKKLENEIEIALVNLSADGKLGGVDLCQQLHEIDPEIKVVVCSGRTFDPVIKNYKDFGFTATLDKPFTIDDLRKVLEGV